MVRLRRAAESKGRKNGRQNVLDEKKKILCTH